MMSNHKYTDEAIAEAVKVSITVSEVMRRLGVRPTGGGHTNISHRIRKLELDISHFEGKRFGWRNGWPRKTAAEILIVMPEGSRRVPHPQLKRALLESGMAYECFECGIIKWRKQPLTLEVDHEDGDWLNNRIENLRFLCPNCHSQTDTYGNKKR